MSRWNIPRGYPRRHAGVLVKLVVAIIGRRACLWHLSVSGAGASIFWIRYIVGELTARALDRVAVVVVLRHAEPGLALAQWGAGHPFTGASAADGRVALHQIRADLLDALGAVACLVCIERGGA